MSACQINDAQRERKSMLRKWRKKGVSKFGNNSCLVTWLFSMGKPFLFQAQLLLFTKTQPQKSQHNHQRPGCFTWGWWAELWWDKERIKRTKNSAPDIVMDYPVCFCLEESKWKLCQNPSIHCPLPQEKTMTFKPSSSNVSVTGKVKTNIFIICTISTEQCFLKGQNCEEMVLQ